MNELIVRDLGLMGYEQALAEQRRVHADVVAGASSMLLIVEHHPVVTISKRPEARAHLLATEAMLTLHGVQVCHTDRGGDITYHGPGQIVAYPIIDLRPRNLNLRQYVWLLEQAIINTLAKFMIPAHRDSCAVGVWVGGQHNPTGDTRHCQSPQTLTASANGAKIAAIGVRGSRWVTMHGLALNVHTNLDHYKLIVPCGLVGRPVTSMNQQLAERCPNMAQVKHELIAQLQSHLSISRTFSLPNIPAR